MQRKITMVTRLVDRFGCKKIRPNAARNKSPAKNRILKLVYSLLVSGKIPGKEDNQADLYKLGWLDLSDDRKYQPAPCHASAYAEYQHSQKKSQAGTINNRQQKKPLCGNLQGIR